MAAPVPAGADWLVPDWPAPPGVWALCTTRTGGSSQPPYASLNLGTHVGDDPAAVQANRLALQAAVQARTPTARAVFLNQMHGNGVVHLDAATPDGTEADACVATAPGTVCTIMVADCLPVLLAHRNGQVMAAAHAGWRGLAGVSGVSGVGVLETVFKRFMALTQAQQAQAAIKNEAFESSAPSHCADILVWLGPCIGPQAFEVGTEVRAAFCDHDSAAAAHFVAQGAGKYLADLAALARQRLRALGVEQVYGNDSSAAWCTVGNASRFFSHRLASQVGAASGRFAVCIWRD